jgi:hypothetical protein
MYVGKRKLNLKKIRTKQKLNFSKVINGETSKKVG